MYFIAERNGRITVENSFQDRFLKWMYTHRTGRILLRPLVTPKVSEFGGWVLNSGISKVAIRPFIKKHGIDMSEYEKKKYSSYNDFFQRKLSSGARRVEEGADIFVSPCDSRAAVYKISEKSMFVIKHTAYTVESLLRSRRLAEKYTGGYVWVLSLIHI